FQLAELDKAAPKPAEDEELASLRQVLASAERVERLCAESYTSLYESDEAILAGLGTVWRKVADLAALDPRFEPYLEARDGIKSQLEDLALFLRRYADGIEASPARRGGVRTPARRDALPARDGADAVRGALRRGSAAGVGMERARHRRRRVLRFPESGGGPSAARANRVGRRAVADHARDQ